MDGINSQESLNFYQFIISYVSLSVIAGLFTYRLLNSLMDNIILPLIDITILPDFKFNKLTSIYNYKKESIQNKFNKNEYIYVFKPGIFLKELVIWCFTMIILFLIYKTIRK